MRYVLENLHRRWDLSRRQNETVNEDSTWPNGWVLFLLEEKVVHSKIFYIADMNSDLNAMRCDRIIGL